MKRFFSKLLISSILLLTLWFAGFIAFLYQVPFTPANNVVVADAVIVLTGGRGRVDLGLKRLSTQKATRLFISGVNADASPQEILNEARKRIANEVKPPEGAKVEIGYEATSTIGNAEEVAKWIGKNHIASIRLVTANYHMPRSLLEFRAQLPDLQILPDPVIPEGFSRSQWWKSRYAASMLMIEYHKTIASYLRHKVIAWDKSV